MTTTSAPFGFVPVRNGLNGTATGQETFNIASAYATSIFCNDPAKLDNGVAGTIQASAAGEHMVGIFEGCEYTTSDGYYRIRQMWTASQALLSGTTCLAYVIRNPFMEFIAQGSATIAQTGLGFGGDAIIGTGNATQGTSTSQLNATLGSGTTSKQFRIVGLHGLPNNAWGDTYTIVRVVMNNLHGFMPIGVAASWV